MKIGQAIDEIFKDINKEYQGVCVDLFRYTIKYDIESESIKLSGPFGAHLSNVLTKRSSGIDWKLVQKPVTFMEAVESGKPFRPESWRDNTEMELDDFMCDISSHSNEGIREYLIGKFYIKEDN